MMSFVTEFNSLPLDSLSQRCLSTTTDVALETMGKPHLYRFKQTDTLGLPDVIH